MIPIMWRYLLRHYLQVFFLAVFTFIAILLITRMYEIFSFAALGVPIYMVLLFTLYQIPYILPYAIAISSLLAAMLLTMKLSRTHEVTAIRAAGIGIKEITSPILILSLFFALLNFLIVSELTPHTRYLSKELLHTATVENPLLLMKKSKLLKLDDSYVDMKMVRTGKEANDVLFIAKNSNSDRLNLLFADKLAISKNRLKGKNVSIISSIDSKKSDGFDHLIIENQESMETNAENLTRLMQDSELVMGVEHVPSKKLFTDLKQKKQIRPKDKKRVEYEMSRRLFFPVATFTFTLLGLSYGLSIGRETRRRAVLIAALLAGGTLFAFLIGKSYYATPWRSHLSFFIPQLILIAMSLITQKRLTRGVE